MQLVFIMSTEKNEVKIQPPADLLSSFSSCNCDYTQLIHRGPGFETALG